MSIRTLLIAGLSAAFAFAGGYALLDNMQPDTHAQASGRPADPSKVVAVPGSALVPMNDGSTAWMLVGPDGTVLAGPDGRPPTEAAAETAAEAAPVVSAADLVGTYLEGFPEAYGGSQDAATKRSKDERRDHEDHDDEDDDHDSKDRKDREDHKDEKDHKDDKHHDDDHDDHATSYALTTGAPKPAKPNARSRK